MSRTLHDQVIDDEEEETCPLCVEEFDLSDQAFRPCPCGYQVCQFCYHNVRTNMNGLCPACRRPYDDSTIEFRKPSPEEEAAWKSRQALKQKKSAAAQAKEAQKREADTLSRKHLSGLRVVQKNLVYVTGINPPTISEDKLLEELREQKFFGQYGKIVKIVVSKAKDHLYPQSIGVYITYERKEDAANCIEAVDGRENGDRILRAQHGTTKYCSAYLRHEICQNRSCMFLHEPGEDRDSFTRQDLSSYNVNSSGASHPPPPQSQQPVAAAHSKLRQDLSSTPQPADNPEAPALPSSASWASKPFVATMNRTPSQSVISASQTPVPSPARVVKLPVASNKTIPSHVPSRQEPESTATSEAELVQANPSRAPNPFAQVLKTFASSNIGFVFSSASLSAAELQAIRNYPPLFDINGGAKRHAMRLREEQERIDHLERNRLQSEDRLAMQTVSAVEGEDHPERGGSHQLGGEPDEHQDLRDQSRTASAQFSSDNSSGNRLGLEDDMSNLGLAGRGLSSQQQQQLLLQQFKNSSAATQSSTQPGGPLSRNASRFSFANDTATASTNVKPVANPKLMSQQASMMPSHPGGNSYPQHAQQNQQPQQPFYTTTVSGPPPGLKTTGTPPVSGRGMFGQGHGFASNALGYGATYAGRGTTGDVMYRRDTGQSDVAKHQSSTKVQDEHLLDNVSTTGFNQSRQPVPMCPPGLDGLGQSQDQSPGVIGTPTREKRASETKQINPATPSAMGRPMPKLSTETTDKTSKNETKPFSHSDTAFESPTVASVRSSKDKTPAALVQSTKTGQIAKQTAPSKTPTKMPAKKEAGIVTPSAIPSRPTVVDSATVDARTNRQHPGKIDLSSIVMKPDNISTLNHSAIPSRVGTPLKLSNTSMPTTPNELDRRVAPRTLRVLATPTPKTETPPAVQIPGPAIPGPLTGGKLASRQHSVTSSVVPPGTPTSDLISDTVSLTSTSVSRANSPPPPGPNIIGSAPARLKTKSQQRKDRVERAKQVEEDKKLNVDVASPITGEDTVQEAIIGRKKKTKKPSAPPKARPIPSAATTRPPTPVEPEPAASPVVPEHIESSPVPPTPPEPTPSTHPVQPAAPEEITPAALMADLVSEDSELFSCGFDVFLKTHAQLDKVYKPPQPIKDSDFGDDPPSAKWPDDPDLLRRLTWMFRNRKGSAVHLGGSDGRIWSRSYFSPRGAYLTCLEPALEQRYCSLEHEVHATPEPLRFRPPVAKPSVDLPHVDVESIQRGVPVQDRARDANAMEKAVEEGSKKGSFLVGNAEQYVNEFIMPVFRSLPPGDGAVQPVGTDTLALATTPKKNRGANLNAASLSPEVLERMIADAKRVAEDTDGQLRRLMKKNRKLLGLAR